MRRFTFPSLVLVAALPIVILDAPVARAFVPPTARVQTFGEMVLVPGASYKFGKQAVWGGPHAGQMIPGADAEGVTVTVGTFFLDRTEVTVRAYGACVSSGKCVALSQGNETNDCTYDRPGYAEHPLNCVSFDEAKAFCGSLGKRLPDEFEWELAERGPTSRPFPWGEAPPTPKHVNACDASCVREELKKGSTFTSLWVDTGGDDLWAFTAPVGTYPDGVSQYGALDLSGNVEEWVLDLWGPISATPTTSVPPGGYEDHVVRGGSWDLGTIDTFSGVRRSAAAKDTRTSWLGFRCARDGA